MSTKLLKLVIEIQKTQKIMYLALLNEGLRLDTSEIPAALNQCNFALNQLVVELQADIAAIEI